MNHVSILSCFVLLFAFSFLIFSLLWDWVVAPAGIELYCIPKVSLELIFCLHLSNAGITHRLVTILALLFILDLVKLETWKRGNQVFVFVFVFTLCVCVWIEFRCMSAMVLLVGEVINSSLMDSKSKLRSLGLYGNSKIFAYCLITICRVRKPSETDSLTLWFVFTRHSPIMWLCLVSDSLWRSGWPHRELPASAAVKGVGNYA